jgi:hypothetical protein
VSQRGFGCPNSVEEKRMSEQTQQNSEAEPKYSEAEREIISMIEENGHPLARWWINHYLAQARSVLGERVIRPQAEHCGHNPRTASGSFGGHVGHVVDPKRRPFKRAHGQKGMPGPYFLAFGLPLISALSPISTKRRIAAETFGIGSWCRHQSSIFFSQSTGAIKFNFLTSLANFGGIRFPCIIKPRFFYHI